jgi:hypothetical protein
VDRSSRRHAGGSSKSRWPIGAGYGALDRYENWSPALEARILQLFLRFLVIVSRFLAFRLGLQEGGHLWIRVGFCGFGAASLGYRFEPLRVPVAAWGLGWGWTERSLGAGS